MIDWRSDKLLREIDSTPEHAVDFCDTCGDCLDCFAEDPCPYARDGRHLWVTYEGQDAVGPPPPDRRSVRPVSVTGRRRA